MAAIEAIGKQAILDMYDAYGIDTWGLFESKRIKIAGQGADELSQWLDRFIPAGSTATYQIRLYEGIPYTEVDERTGYRYCYNCKIIDHYGGMGVMNGYTAQLEQRLKKLEDSGADDDDETDINKILMGWLEKPEKLATAIGAVKHLFGGPAPAVMPAVGSTIGSTSQPVGNDTTDPDEIATRLENVLNRLEKADKHTLEHLEKLADIAEKKPETFKFLINTLKTM